MKEKEKECYYGYTCDLIHKLEQTTDVYAFLHQECPIPDVLENLPVISKGNLKCICCIYSNALLRLASSSHRKIHKTQIPSPAPTDCPHPPRRKAYQETYLEKPGSW